MPPQTRYAKSGDVNIAYQVFGGGPFDLVFVPGFVSHVEMYWENPHVVTLLEGLASFSRVIMFDKRGTGLSDRVAISELPTLEERMDDIRAVMDAAGSKQAAIFGISEGGPLSTLFAASYPERVRALVLYGTYAKFLRADDYYIGLPEKVLMRFLEMMESGWATGPGLEAFSPGLARETGGPEWWARFLRSAASPGAASAYIRMIADIDARHVLPAISAPTLVLHRTHDRLVRTRQGKDLAERIPGAKYVELPGEDHAPFFKPEQIVAEIQEFLTGVRPASEPDRVLATVLFTDIVASTERAVELGDKQWTDLLTSYYELARRQMERMRGREVKTTGDGFLATFDGPARAVRCAEAIVEGAGSMGLSVRAGLHTGECELLDGDIGGIAVHIGARVAAEAGPQEVLVSSTVKDLVAGSGIVFEDRGARQLKGVPDEWRLFAVTG